MRRRKTKLQVKRRKMLGVWGQKCRFISLQSQSFDWCPPCTCFSRNVSIRVVGLDCGGNFTFTSHFQTHLWSPLANDVALVVLIMCVEKKEDPWIGGRSSFSFPSHFLLPTGAEHFPLVLTSFFHRGVTSDLEFALTRLCSSQLFPQKSSPAQNWKVPHMC